MNRQFQYYRKETIPSTEEGKAPEVKIFIDSFNLDMVIRSIGLPDGRRLVLLNDLHERWQDVPVKNKVGKNTTYKREKNTFQSEIYLEPEDNERFINLKV